MIKEFAVEPDAIVGSYRDFSYVIEKFGVWEGRVISQFPSKWKRLVYEAAQARHKGRVEQTKIVERLRGLPDGVLMSLSRPGGDGEWITQALNEHQRKPFDYILSNKSHAHPCVVLVEELDGNHKCLCFTREQCIRREPEVMANSCDLLLRTAVRVKLVDPHFDLYHDRFLQPFLSVIQRLRQGTTVEIYRDDKIDPGTLVQRATRYLPKCLPLGVTVRLVVWTQEPMHNRFLMTNHGGVRFGVGLDAAGPDSALEDEVSLMLPDVWRSRWTQYEAGDVVAEWVGA